MITMSYAHANSISQNVPLLRKLFQTEMPVKTATRLKRILGRVGFAAKHVQEAQYNLQMTAAKLYALCDSEGNPVLDEAGELTFKSDEDKGQANKEVMLGIAPVMKQVLTLEVEPLNLDDTGLNLTLQELDMLSPLFVQDEITSS